MAIFTELMVSLGFNTVLLKAGAYHCLSLSDATRQFTDRFEDSVLRSVSSSTKTSACLPAHQPNFQPILALIFVTIASTKVKLIPDFYTWAIVLKNQEELGEKHFLLLASPG